jgi:hypothetical protein
MTTETMPSRLCDLPNKKLIAHVRKAVKKLRSFTGIVEGTEMALLLLCSRLEAAEWELKEERK